MTLEKYLTEGDGVLDIGANDGHYAAMYAKSVGETGYVLAVEPDPAMMPKCEEQRATYPQIHIVNAAVSCAEGTAILFRDIGDAKRNSLWKENLLHVDDEKSPPIEVPAVTLDSLAARVPKLVAIKIDAQGAEGEILAGGSETLKNRALTWYVELWKDGLSHAGSDVSRVMDVFEQHGWVPVGSTWERVRRDATTTTGHGAIDVTLQHRERAH